jgi:putative CocE/NonD family hydrolase
MDDALTPFRRLAARAEELAARAVFETGIPMRDGPELAADVYLPRDASGPVPAIVEITPYGKDNQLLVVPDALHYRSHGYAFVAVDTRGRGRSEGEWSAMAHDPEDTFDIIEWVAAQDWCDGGVGTTGLSYMGWVQWAGASERPPHLRCMISTSAAGRWQQEIPYTNGVLQLYFAWWVYLVRRRIDESHRMGLIDWDEILSLLPVDAIGKFIDPTGPSWQNLVGRDELDEFWSALRFDGRYDQIDVPCLHVTGWYDLEDLLGAFHHYEHMVAASPARDRQYLIVGPWSHVKCRYPDSSYADVDFGPEAALDMDAVHLRWFDRWLKGLDNGVDGDPRVQLFEPGTNVWRSADRWPLSDDRMTLYLRSGDGSGRLDAAPPAEDEPADSYAYDPLDPVPTGLDVRQYPLEDVPLDQTENEARPDVLTYTSDELDASLTISGWAWLDLFASSDCEDTDWHVKLTDVTPDGRSRKVTQGCLRASYRHGLSDPAPLEPDLPCRFRVEFWPTHHVFRPGHRIRVSVTSSDFPWFARNLNRFGPVAQQSEPRTARNTVHHAAERPSRLVLPVERSIAAGST